MSSRWVEKIRYSKNFQSAEEASQFLEEGLKWFDEIEREMRTFQEGMLGLTQRFFEPFRPVEAKPEDVISRIEKLENELKEIKELVKRKYIKKAKVELH